MSAHVAYQYNIASQCCHQDLHHKTQQHDSDTDIWITWSWVSKLRELPLKTTATLNTVEPQLVTLPAPLKLFPHITTTDTASSTEAVPSHYNYYPAYLLTYALLLLTGRHKWDKIHQQSRWKTNSKTAAEGFTTARWSQYCPTNYTA